MKFKQKFQTSTGIVKFLLEYEGDWQNNIFLYSISATVNVWIFCVQRAH